MNVFSFAPLYRLINVIKWILGFIFRLVFWKKKKAEKLDGKDDDNRPIEIISVNQTEDGFSSSHNDMKRKDIDVPGNDSLVDWNVWQENDKQGTTEEASIDDMNLFEDMEPTLTRPRMLKVKRNDPVEQKPKSTSRLQAVDSTGFHVQSELGVWVESSSGWDEEVLDDLSEEAASILKEKRRLERQKRTMEQKRKKEELRAIKAEKKTVSHLGMKVN